MKKFKIALAIFALTLCIGGINGVSAYVTEEPLVDFKADFLQNGPHYTAAKEKYTWSGQEVSVTSTTGNRTVQIALCDGDKNFLSDYVWLPFKTGDVKLLNSTLGSIPTSYAGTTYRLRSKLPSPWTQVKINGLWGIDI